MHTPGTHLLVDISGSQRADTTMLKRRLVDHRFTVTRILYNSRLTSWISVPWISGYLSISQFINNKPGAGARGQASAPNTASPTAASQLVPGVAPGVTRD